MPVQPIVGQQFKTANGLRAIIREKGPPDQSGLRFAGEVRNNGTFNYTFWKNDGTSPNANYNLESVWPTDDPQRYFAIMPTTDGAWYVTGPMYNNIPSLRNDWFDKGCRWYLTLTRDANNNPGNPTVTALT